MRTGKTIGKKAQALSGNIQRKICQDTIFPELSGRSFGSLLERAVAQSLVARQRNGEISDLKFQTTVHLTRADICWRVDFSYIQDGQLIYHEAKGRSIEPYATKLKLYRVYGPAPLRISKGSAAMHKVVETVFPTDYTTGKDRSE